MLNLPLFENPSCLQATFPSLGPQNMLQMVPQVSLKQISTRPDISVRVVPASLKSPSSQMPKVIKYNHDFDKVPN